MNGFGLLIAVAALGVDVGWEAGPGGQSYYTIHVEEVLLKPLREGQAIVSKLDSNDRNLTRFQIIVGDHAHAVSSQPGPSGSDMVQHGWRPGENGGTDYLIQVSPERLESLAKGSIIIGQIDPQVTDIRKLFVFSGVQQLPQQLAPSNTPQQPNFLGVGGGLQTASGEVPQQNNSPTRVGAPNFSGVGFNGSQSAGQQTGAGRNGDFPAANGAYTGSQGGPSKAGNNPAQPFNTGSQTQDQWRTAGQTAAPWPDRSRGNNDGYGTGDRMLAVPQFPQGQTQNQVAYGATPQQQQSFAGPAQPNYGQPNYSQQNPGYSQPNPAYNQTPPASTQNLELLLAEAKAQGAAEAKIVAAEAKVAAAEAKAAAASNVTTKEEAKAEEPWLPLILTTLMLFASLGTNVFLGWLAWSFFWRFRDAAGDATRAQSTLFPTRQAA